MKFQIWGAGGGSGHFVGRTAGSGGGGAYIEALVFLNPYDILEIQVVSSYYLVFLILIIFLYREAEEKAAS